jgi:hypothetical protein
MPTGDTAPAYPRQENRFENLSSTTKRRALMTRWLALTVLILLLSGTLAADTSIQTSWFLGPGVEGPVTEWGETFWTSDQVAHSVKGQVSLLAELSDPDAWTKHIIDADTRIDGHANILPANVDGDDWLELVSVLAGTPGEIVVYDRTGSGWTRSTIAPFGNKRLGTTWPYDMDLDGDIDIVASGSEGLVWLANDGGTFTKKNIDVSEGYLYARPGDVDNDSDVDIVVHDTIQDDMHGDLWLFRNDGTMTFSPEKIFSTTPYPNETWRINVGDLDGDGYLDIQTSGEPLRVFLNDGTGTFWLKFTFNDTAAVDGSWLNDFDRDGDLDIMGAHWGGAYYYPRPLFWFENDGSGMSFTYHAIGGDNGDYGDGGMAIDVNLDGLMDALGAYREAGWFEQLSGGGFVEHPFPGANLSWWGAHWIYGHNLEDGPCTGDVDIDVLVADYDTFLLWENHMVTFFKEGEVVSSILDAGEHAQWTTFGWDECMPAGCANEYYIRSEETVSEIKTAPWIGPLSSSGDSLKTYGVADGRYFQYMLVLKNVTAADDISPSIEEVWVTFDPRGCDPVEPWSVRTQGYWKRQCKPKPHEDICANVDSVRVFASLFESYTCDSICDLLNVDPPENDMCRKARRQFMALLLNIASGKLALCNCLEDGREVGDVVAEIDSILSNFSDHHSCEQAKTLADDINNGKGLVPCDSIARIAERRSSSAIVHTAAPNPFGRTTTLKVGLSVQAQLKLSIYDMTGRLVRVLLDEAVGAGAHAVEWDGLDRDGTEMPSGIYVYSIEAGAECVSGKLILVR